MKKISKATTIGGLVLVTLGIMLNVYPSEYPESEFPWCPNLYCFIGGCDLPYWWFHEEVDTCCFRVWDPNMPGWYYCCGAEGCHPRN